VVSEQQKNMMGAFIRQQRELADMSMRQVSSMVGISNPYLSQIERGLRAPSAAVAAGIATALGVSVDELYGPDDARDRSPLLEAIENATELTAAQRSSLAEIYRSFVRANQPEAEPRPDGPGAE
jgi:transcriptional regulator with XRE-family HTH domain